MRRLKLLTAFVILLIILVAGMSTVVLLVNLNNGYPLILYGDLRRHI
jgi:hypothetical protein